MRCFLTFYKIGDMRIMSVRGAGLAVPSHKSGNLAHYISVDAVRGDIVAGIPFGRRSGKRLCAPSQGSVIVLRSGQFCNAGRVLFFVAKAGGYVQLSILIRKVGGLPAIQSSSQRFWIQSLHRVQAGG